MTPLPPPPGLDPTDPADVTQPLDRPGYPAVPPYRAGLSDRAREELDDPDRAHITYEGVWGLVVLCLIAVTALALLVWWVRG